MTNPLLAFFGGIPLFSKLNGEELGEIIRAIQPVTLTEGDFLFKETEPADAAFVVQTGSLSVYLDRRHGRIDLATLEAGSMIGEITLIDGGLRTATVRAISDCTLFRLDKSEFDFLRRNLRPAAYKLIREISITVCSRLRDTNQLIQEQWGTEPSTVDNTQTSEPDALASKPSLLKRLQFWKES
ncbi:MAG: cyclic nucleotide-binding domain-containing protein [Bradymonadia bacterium]